MKQTPNNNFMTSDMLEFEDIYNKTNNAIFFLANLICPNSELANKLYFSIYNICQFHCQKMMKKQMSF